MSLILELSGKDMLPLKQVARLTLKVIFDKKNCGYTTQKTVEKNIIVWNDLVRTQKRITADKFGLTSTDFMPVGKKGSVIDEIEYFLQIICKWLVDDEEGKLDELKESYKRSNIDYRRTARFGFLFPELYTKESARRAQDILKQHMKDNPQDYN